MPSAQTSKRQVQRAVSNAIDVLEKAVKSCGTVKDSAGIPRAFFVVAEHLPVVVKIFSSVQAKLQSDKEETEQVTELYPVIKQVADETYGQITSLEDLYDTVSGDAESSTKMERYIAAVKGSGGKKVETLMIELLNNARLAAVDPFVSEEQITGLRGALKEIKDVLPSLEEEPRAGLIFNNNGSGNQFCHNGNGSQNHCSGGFQVNGDNQNARYTYAEKTKGDNI